jgi:hypothetical protein
MMKKTPFKKTWDKLMAKETTTTFMVTVTHSGAHSGFWDLFSTCGRHKSSASVSHKEVSTDTKAVPAKARYSPEQKMGRMLLKEACEAAGLKFSVSANVDFDRYNVQHSKYTRKGGQTVYDVVLEFATIEFWFRQGVGSEGVIKIRDRDNYYTNNDPELTVSFADPKVVEQLAQLFAQWGKNGKPNIKSMMDMKVSLKEYIEQGTVSI